MEQKHKEGNDFSSFIGDNLYMGAFVILLLSWDLI